MTDPILLSKARMARISPFFPLSHGIPRVDDRRVADPGYDADWFREALAKRQTEACIPSKPNRKIQTPHDRALYRKQHRIENMFGKLKAWRRIPTRYDRCAHAFMGALAIAAIVIFWI